MRECLPSWSDSAPFPAASRKSTSRSSSPGVQQHSQSRIRRKIGQFARRPGRDHAIHASIGLMSGTPTWARNMSIPCRKNPSIEFPTSRRLPPTVLLWRASCLSSRTRIECRNSAVARCDLAPASRLARATVFSSHCLASYLPSSAGSDVTNARASSLQSATMSRTDCSAA